VREWTNYTHRSGARERERNREKERGRVRVSRKNTPIKHHRSRYIPLLWTQQRGSPQPERGQSDWGTAKERTLPLEIITWRT